ncbi:MAG TPA: hypothetical protein VJG32_19225 [Anaerolineae bacterium]|nr:hypothetical protein [Anaerolineae bacterium]
MDRPATIQPRLKTPPRDRATAPPTDLTSDSDAQRQELPPSVQRLIVLAPDLESGESELAQRIWLLASPRGLEILYVSLYKTVASEPLVRRQLATLAALTRDRRTRVETLVVLEHDWLPAIRQVWRAGDLIVCHQEQLHAAKESLASALPGPVYLLSGWYQRPAPEPSGRLRQLLSLVGSIGILAGFFVMQAEIARTYRDGAYYLLMGLSVLLEVIAVVLWARFLM